MQVQRAQTNKKKTKTIRQVRETIKENKANKTKSWHQMAGLDEEMKHEQDGHITLSPKFFITQDIISNRDPIYHAELA